jgi:alanine racemase
VLKPDAKVVTMGGVALNAATKYLDNNIIPAVNTLPQLDAIRSAADATNASDVPVYLQVDSGMTRLGLDAMERQAVLDRPDELIGQRLNVKTVMSHLACADFVDPTLTNQQYDSFVDFTGRLASKLPYTFRRSLSNSYALYRDPKVHFAVVRPGLSL